MSAKHPAAVATFLKANARARMTYRGAIESYDNDEHAVTFDWRAASDVLSGEDAFDDEASIAIGYLNGDLPLYITLGKAALPVFAMADGEPLRIAASFEGFTKKLTTSKAASKPTAKAATKAASKVASKPSKSSSVDTLAGPATVAWPKDAVVSCRFGMAADGRDFLWFDKVSPKANDDLLLRNVKPQGYRTSFAVGSKWDAKASTKLDRGTGVILDFASYDRRTPVVTPRVQALLTELQPKGLEFLPVRAEVGKKRADLFIMNVKLAVPCLDPQSFDVEGTRKTLFPHRMPRPRELVLLADRVPTEPVFFRPAEYPEVILATRAMVDRLRGERFSGLNFVPIAKHEFL